MSSSFESKVAIVTGGGTGIGGATARRLSAEGARVVVVDVNADAANKTVAGLVGAGVAVVADAATPEGVEHYIRVALDRFGRIDLAHLNVGVGNNPGFTGDIEVADYDRVLGISLRGNFLGLRAVIRQFLEQGEGGSIVLTSSLAGVGGGVGAAPYTAAKHGVVGLAKTAAAEYGTHGIRVNALCPGFVDTDLLRNDLDFDGGGAERRKGIEARIPLGRFAQPDEIAAAAVWLLSADAGYVSGTTIVVDGALTSAV
ncbi:SDR family oxidoreductase [Nocardia sp. R6R-6]|uniref:SDR family oxidoreductase n=1 Tax=Nocardia sp. R6R-6 TaxID=3459303 RepID=UPI00403D8EF9